jgi:hypothetical protein
MTTRLIGVFVCGAAVPSSLKCRPDQRQRPLVNVLDMARPFLPSGLKVGWDLRSLASCRPGYNSRCVLVRVWILLVIACHASIIPRGQRGMGAKVNHSRLYWAMFAIEDEIGKPGK